MVCGGGLAGVAPFTCCGHRKLEGGVETPPKNLGHPRSSSGTKIMRNEVGLLSSNVFEWPIPTRIMPACCVIFLLLHVGVMNQRMENRQGFLGFSDRIGDLAVMHLYLEPYNFLFKLSFWLWFSYSTVLLSLRLTWGLSTHPYKKFGWCLCLSGYLWNFTVDEPITVLVWNKSANKDSVD